MTNREAIEELSGMYRICVIDSLDGKIEAEKKNTAIDMAINALEEQEKRRWIHKQENKSEASNFGVFIGDRFTKRL